MSDIEFRLIAALLIDPRRLAGIDLDPLVFTDPIASAAAGAILDLEAAGQAVDVRAISARLDATGHDSGEFRRRLAKTLTHYVPAHRAADYWTEIAGREATT